jgi:hypothetical protein
LVEIIISMPKAEHKSKIPTFSWPKTLTFYCITIQVSTIIMPLLLQILSLAGLKHFEDAVTEQNHAVLYTYR